MSDFKLAKKLYDAFIATGAIEALEGRELAHHLWLVTEEGNLFVYKGYHSSAIIYDCPYFQFEVCFFEGRENFYSYKITLSKAFKERELTNLTKKLDLFIDNHLKKAEPLDIHLLTHFSELT